MVLSTARLRVCTAGMGGRQCREDAPPIVMPESALCNTQMAELGSLLQ